MAEFRGEGWPVELRGATHFTVVASTYALCTVGVVELRRATHFTVVASTSALFIVGVGVSECGLGLGGHKGGTRQDSDTFVVVNHDTPLSNTR